MATPISEVIARNTEVLEGMKAILAKAEEKPVDDPTTEQKEEGEPTEKTEAEEETEDKVEDDCPTREEFTALTDRVKALENKLMEKEEQATQLKEAVEASTEALNRVSAFFKKPSNRAMLAEGEEVRAKTEATEPKAEKNIAEKWLAMPAGKQADAFYKANEAEILKHL